MRKIDLTNFRVATSETARQINRRIALNFIRRHNPLSRADLARRSGLQRSTVSAIVDQLIDEGWVTEGAIGRAPRGRRPRFLHLNVERAGILAVELRPEVTTVGLAGVDARFVEQTSWPTPHSAEAFVRKLARTVTAMQRAHPRVVCEGMGVSLPGRVDASGRLVFAPNLRWRDIDLASLLEAAIGLPVVLENAANACALAELLVRPASRAHPASPERSTCLGRRAVCAVGILLASGGRADAQGWDLTFFVGRAFPTYDERLTLRPSTPTVPGVDIDVLGSPLIKADGGPVFGGALAFEFGVLGIEGRLDATEVGLEFTGARYNLRGTEPPFEGLTASVTLADGRFDADRIPLLSVNARIRTPGPVALIASGGLSYLNDITVTGSVPLRVEIPGIPSTGFDPRLTLRAVPGQSEHRWG